MPFTIKVTHEVKLDPKLSAQLDKLIAALGTDDIDLTKLKSALATQHGLREDLELVLAEQPKS